MRKSIAIASILALSIVGPPSLSLVGPAFAQSNTNIGLNQICTSSIMCCINGLQPQHANWIYVQ